MIFQVTDKNNWALTFALDVEAGGSMELRQRGRRCLQGKLDENVLCIEIFTYQKDASITLQAPKPTHGGLVKLVWRSHVVELWLDGICVDEEWPIGDCLKEGEVDCKAVGLQQPELTTDTNCLPEKDVVIGNAQYWLPQQENSGVGDCMPFFDGQRYHLYYLKDRRSHCSKYRLGAHQFAHISTTDLSNWVSHPLAVGITHQWEGSICTGSVIKEGDLYYAFYAVRMSDGTSAQLSWATSKDGIHFEKSEKYFALHHPYETTSARDPHVFKDEQGLFHMLVTTDHVEKLPARRQGCLAHLTSTDLDSWKQEDPFVIPGYTDQPECTDYFQWNGWYYYIFSNYGCAKYRYSRAPFGPWLKPEREILDGLLYRVPKTAGFFGNRRIAAGFLCKEASGNSYGGYAVFRELVQNQDGTLGTALVKEMLPEAPGRQTALALDCALADAYTMQEIGKVATGGRVVAQIQPESVKTCYGLVLCQEGGAGYEIRLEPWHGAVAFCQAHCNPFTTPHHFCLDTVKDLDQAVTLELVIKDGLADLCINGQYTLVRRIESLTEGDWTVSCFTKDGAAKFSVQY